MANERRKDIEDFRSGFKRELHNHISYESAEKLYGKFSSDYKAAAGFYFVIRAFLKEED